MQIIHVHADAPLKPAPGAACNGCGVCCLAEPCPAGMLLSRRRRGPCAALRWADDRYVCGLASGSHPVWPSLPRWLAALLRRLARRWISAGSGCDCSLEATR